MKMELFNLLFLLSFASANHVAVKDFTFGFCEETTARPLEIENATIHPFPIPLVTGTVLEVTVGFNLMEECPVGTTVKLSMTLLGLVEIPIPCLAIDDISLGSCEYGIDDLLAAGADLLCPTVPAGQECHLPLHPGIYGGFIQFTFPEINPIIGDLLAAGDYKVDAAFLLEDGTEFTCLTFTLELTGSEA